MQQSHRKRKPNKSERIKLIEDGIESNMKKVHIKGMIQGGEVVATEILNFVNNGKDLDYIRAYCESILKSGKDGTMEKVVNK